ncbi:YggS family pyridoxal phosphate-dependent enzyme [Marinigracilibium pacificum]|uniref:Pyridoxal phosphate homeostasis protein n=1 Tax=Marinigracilibium pacificum TaxID=2729599 RepID=A0A848IW98_9BACT|nr:YggS family pyridoxal phosphate-dependent enzyme [Marinigracilibium pacificum]NMM48607.1 YggS family pyridoxal phosphate-dependent enzyme [Marinigracilibium pacificum]
MSELINNYNKVKEQIAEDVTLVAVSKTKPNQDILELYNAGQRVFGENKVQELTSKQEELPKDIQWHMIGHLQRNKVKYIVPFVSLIHSVDSKRLAKEINKEAKKNDRIIECLLQVHIAEEESKFGFDENEIIEIISNNEFSEFDNIKIVGLMGMATFTDDQDQVRKEFKNLKEIFGRIKAIGASQNISMKTLSMGMSDDFAIAIEEGSTMVRVGSKIFGERNY